MGIIAEQWRTSEGVHLDVQRATGLRRATGLIGRRLPAPGCALCFTRCSSVHTVAMRRSIDVVFLGHGGSVLRTCTLGPWRAAVHLGAREVLELAPGEAARVGLVPGASARLIKTTKRRVS
ncbi:MAG: DUF192 domain-containing protein [Solirubrobacterales bacterium]